MKNYLEFEKDIKTLEDEMELLKSPGNESISEVDTSKIKSTQDQINSKLKSIYSSLNSWQKTQVARHEDRPRASFYIRKIFNNFIENNMRYIERMSIGLFCIVFIAIYIEEWDSIIMFMTSAGTVSLILNISMKSFFW